MRHHLVQQLVAGALATGILILTGCGEAQEGQETETPTSGVPLSIAPTGVTLSGTFASDPGTTTVLVNGARATITGGTWSANVRSIDGRYQTVRVELYVNNILTDAHEMTVENSTAH